MQATRSVYLVTLAKATANPLLKESDEEGAGTKPEGQDSRFEGEHGGGFQGQEGRGLQGQEGAIEGQEDQKPVVIDLEGIAGRVVALPIEAGHLASSGGRRRRADLLHPPRGGPAGPGPAGAREAVAEAVRPQDPRGGNARRGDRRIPALGRPQEDPLRSPARPPRPVLAAGPRDRRRGQVQQGRRRAQARRDLGAGRAAGGMGADLPRSLADQPRLLLRDQHARGRLGRHATEVRASSCPTWPRRDDLEPRDPHDAQRAVGRPQLPGRRRAPLRAQADPRRPARGRLRGRRRPLPVQDDLRRRLLGPEPPRPADGARASMSSRATSCWRSTARTSRPTARSIGRSRGPPASGSSSRSGPRPTAPDRARSSSSRSPTRARSATAPGSRGTSARSTSGPRGGSRTSTCPTRRDPDMNTSSGTSSRRLTRRRSSSTSGSTAAARWPTITSSCSAGRWSATGRPGTARRSDRPTRRSSAPRS